MEQIIFPHIAILSESPFRMAMLCSCSKMAGSWNKMMHRPIGQFFIEINMKVLQWPSNSSDLTPIENA